MSRLAIVPSVIETTDRVEARWAFEFWRSTALAPFGDVARVRPDGPFRARRLAVAQADWVMTRTVSSPVGLTFGRRHVDRNAPETVVVGLGLDGLGYHEQRGRGGRIAAGTVSFLSRNRPFVAGTHCDYEELRLAVPRRTFEAWVGEADAFAGRLIADEAASGAFQTCFRAFAASVAWLSEDEARIAVEGVLHMLRNLARDPHAPSGVQVSREAVLALARAHIARRMHDPGLDPDEIHTVLGLSRAHLYRAFSDTDGVAAAIREARLLRAHRRLTSPTGDRPKIATIAYACGFTDVPTFNRAFRKRFGHAPGELRADRP
ncbi:helix-turn-helix domain-containing protein [Methylobacterium sp. Leaf108]|uniref:helix-turn-helix domain-containing protein n=1 Tax=Methylobacterium sp. Leaf108 TaxID=1736256 RepID=UPI0006F647A1|nr:helix-turn-helix domain-containing protein [Methylobacterium sp. Leaf108]KQP52543.1 AraC family transcriptional regulator [Methylobacterium sp. Leaf108]